MHAWVSSKFFRTNLVLESTKPSLCSLAYMEMYMAIAYIVRRFEVQLYHTTEKDMQWDDMVVPQFHGEFRALTKPRTE